MNSDEKRLAELRAECEGYAEDEDAHVFLLRLLDEEKRARTEAEKETARIRETGFRERARHEAPLRHDPHRRDGR